MLKRPTDVCEILAELLKLNQYDDQKSCGAGTCRAPSKPSQAEQLSEFVNTKTQPAST